MQVTYLSNILVPFFVGLDPNPFADMFGHRIVVEREMVGGEISSEAMTIVDN